MASPQESSSQCLKRKLVDDCLSKDCKSRRIKAENGPSLDSSATRCNCCCTRPNLANDCVNFLKSGVPNRIMYYKQGSWHNFPEQIMKSLINEFKGNKSSVCVCVMDDEPLLVDFLSMTLVNLKTRKQRSVAWFDDTGKCFFPSLFFDEDSDELSRGDSGTVDNAAQGIMLDKVANSPPEVVKQVVLESSSPVPQKPCTADILRKKITSVERGSEGFLFVQNLFLSGMGSFASPSSILHVHRYSPNDITAQCRLEAFERQMKSTKEERGDANVRYGWLGSRKNDIIRILINGLGTTANPAEKASLSAGVYLSPENRAFTSVGLCDVDEKGVQYMLLCRLILGNMEPVEPGSQESFPSSEMFDSGVDDCSNPKCYVMWPSHLNTHMRLEYLVSFKLIPKVRNYLLDLKGLWFNPSPKDVAVDISTLQPVRQPDSCYLLYHWHAGFHVMCETGDGPTSPWISFRVLFGVIQDNISSVARELLFHHYEELKPSLWYKPSVETEPCDPARAIQEQLSLDGTGNNCSLTLSVNHGDSHAPNAMVEHLTVHSTKGSVPCLAPSGGQVSSSSAVVVYRGSSSVLPEGTDSPKQIMSPGYSGAHCAKNQGTCAARVAPTVQDGILRAISGKSATPGGEVCNSVTPTTGPTGYACLAPSNASKTHGSSASDSTRKGCESAIPSLALGNPKSTGAKRLSCAPKLTPECKEFLSLGIASQVHSVKGQDSLTSVAIPSVHVPGRGNSRSTSSKDQGSLALSIMPKGHDGLASNKTLKHRESPRADKFPESGRSQAQDAVVKVYDAPTSITGDPKDQTGVHGSQNKSSGPGLDASSYVTGAASALVALSTPREKGGR
ncbi:hypothetical protein PR202_ga07210 [Eleusine coracana subsp. coracana]|uniref:PARP catalytic domain-containing protein n=1 Tax=Eleusine coracana subsp. coracana TaxID=191504 RepID=A0AAV5BY28_ELECO|nr:hypothetical protein PR202_ga07210 [Eleusine coracana subsp. coracana]